jgi:hypothetical protein
MSIEKILKIDCLRVHKELASFALITLLLVAYFWVPTFTMRWGDDNGLVPLGADIIARGGALYRDLWVIFFPGSCLWLALCFKLFGATWLVCRIVLLATWIAIFWLLVYLCRQLVAGPECYLPAIMLATIGPWQAPLNTFQWDSLLLVLAMTCLSGQLIERQKTWQKKSFALCSSLIGLTGSAAIICYQVVAPAVGVTYAVCAWLLFRRQGAAQATTFAVSAVLASILAFAALTGYLYFSGSLPYMIEDTVFALQKYGDVNAVPYGYSTVYNFMVGRLPFTGTSLWFVLLKLLSALWFWLPCEIVKWAPLVGTAGILTSLASGCGNKFEQQKPVIFIYLSTGLAYFLAELHRAELMRLVWGGQLLIILAVYVLVEVRRKLPQSRLAISLLFTSLALALVVHEAGWQLSFAGQKSRTIETRRGPVNTIADLRIIPVLQKLVPARGKVLVYPYDTIIYFLSETNCPAGVACLQYNLQDERIFHAVLSDMDKSQVDYAVWNISEGNDDWKDGGFPNYQALRPDQLLVEPYLVSNFSMVKSYGNYRLLRRKACHRVGAAAQTGRI